MADSTIRTRRLTAVPALAFPFRVEQGCPVTCNDVTHIRDQIEQVLFTDPRERVFRPEFGAGTLSCPCSLLPQAAIDPFCRSAKLWLSPAAMATNPELGSGTSHCSTSHMPHAAMLPSDLNPML